MKITASLEFGHVIAFLLPGFVAFYGLGYVSPRAAELINSSMSKDPGIGIIVFGVLISLSCGMVLGAVREVVFDNLHLMTGVKATSLDYGKLVDEHVLAASQAAIANTFAYCEFHGNMLVAILFVAVARLIHGGFDLQQEWPLVVVLVLATLVSCWAHRAFLKQTYQVLAKIIPAD